MLARLTFGDPLGDNCGGFSGRRVLPQTQDGPAGIIEMAVDAAVTINVPRNLRQPVRRVRPGRGAVLRTAVPEATVHKHSELPACEDDIGPDGLPSVHDR